ncbi:MAG: carbon-nitrogen hydrolase family protein [Armatimonadetes bacterium]|nr:carbon-nitrogen hydrolase family protein [Armatimonadota bacterium]
MATKTVLASINARPEGGVDTPENLDKLTTSTELWVRRAARMGARILAFTEVYPQLNHPGDAMFANTEPADGGSLLRAIDLARKYDVDIVWPRFEVGTDGMRNSSIYIDRHGDVLGRYYKMFPTIGEIDAGILPGDGGVCVESEYGRIGFAICFDLNFQELRDTYRPLEPDAIIFSSMYRGGVKVEFWAVDLGCYMVSSHGTELGKIVDRGGRVLKEATYELLVTAEVNLNSVQLHMDYNWGKMDEMLAKYGPQLHFDYYTPEARYVITSDTVPIGEILREYELLGLNEYWRRAKQRRLESLGQA